ncbi:MAG: hypothetical protein ACLURG_09225 [Gemmiger sp.]
MLNLTLALPLSSLMYRHRLPVGAQFRSYEVPVCAAMALVLLLPPLCKHKLKRWQGGACLVLYILYLAAVLLLPPLCKHKLKRWQGGACLVLYILYLAAVLLLPLAGA